MLVPLDCRGIDYCFLVAGPPEATALANTAMQLVAAGAVGSILEARKLIERSFPADTFEPSGDGRWDTAYKHFQSLVETTG
jgi:rhamnulokinase